MKSLLIKDANIITQNAKREILRGDVLVEGDTITRIGTVQGGADQVIDAKGDLVIPGLINTHNHVAMSIMKGVADDVPFPTFLDRVFAIDSDRKDEDILVGAELGLLEMVRSGTTTFVDLYYAEDVIARAVVGSGIRGVLCWAVLDQQYTTQKGVPLDNCKRFHQDHRDVPRVTPGIGLQGVYVCSDETFQGAEDFSKRTGALMHFHLSETRKEVYDHKARTGMRPAEHLESIGVLSDRCLAAHAAWLTINEVKALGRSGCSVSTCPVSNMKLATGGVAPLPEMFAHGVNVSIGTDGSTTNNSMDLMADMKILALLQKCYRWDPTVLPAQQVLDLATIGGAKAVGMAETIGSIEVGKKADLVILDGRAPNLRPLQLGTMVSNIVYSGNSSNVKTVICDGAVVMKDRRMTTLDENEVLEKSEGAIRGLMERGRA
jgi:5-methylthioadenosine/S-adenosylhomocysteine deaminase